MELLLDMRSDLESVSKELYVGLFRNSAYVLEDRTLLSTFWARLVSKFLNFFLMEPFCTEDNSERTLWNACMRARVLGTVIWPSASVTLCLYKYGRHLGACMIH